LTLGRDLLALVDARSTKTRAAPNRSSVLLSLRAVAAIRLSVFP